MITLIPRSKLEAHPDNPRKDLGDLSELAASIRKQGLLQNLTVVPSPSNPDTYRIVIGHRRFAASGMVGLDELPCVIDTKMTYPEQIAVMMSENIQRTDLTITERVDGVQMMMDLGMNVGEIVESTGISDTTVRRYAKVGKLNRANMTKAEERGATLMQFAEIADIKDDAMREEALAAAGTNNYSTTMYRVRRMARAAELMPQILEKLSEHATQVKEPIDTTKYCWGDCLWTTSEDILQEISKFKFKKGTNYVFTLSDIRITIYAERSPDADAKEQARREAAERVRVRVKHEHEIASGFKALRDAYMETLTLKGREEAAKRFVLWTLTQGQYLGPALENGIFERVFLAERKEHHESITGRVIITADEIANAPEKKLLLGIVLVAYERISFGNMSVIDSSTGKPKEPEHLAFLNELYAHMEAMGYPISTEERAWLDGTHECFSFNGAVQEGDA